MSAWEDLQAIKSKRNILREKLQKRKREREDIFNLYISASKVQDVERSSTSTEVRPEPEIEAQLLKCLSEMSAVLPIHHEILYQAVCKRLDRSVPKECVINLLQKFATQNLISIHEYHKEGQKETDIVTADHAKLCAMVSDVYEVEIKKSRLNVGSTRKRKVQISLPLTRTDADEVFQAPDVERDIISLISMPSIREKENKKVGEEILELLSKPTAKERSITEMFRSHGGVQLKEFCPHGTKSECQKTTSESCKKLHFKKIIQAHTDETLGDCSFLNTCFHMDTCKYVHYEVDEPTTLHNDFLKVENISSKAKTGTVLYQPQWIQCDLRYLDMTVLGKFAVIMADPPWDIHMELPYGTMSDDEMRQLGVPQLQDEGLIFLWVTGRAMELGRECLKLWGYERVDELIWVKTNQLQRIIRTGRTGHWLNHGKEHCLVGLKGNPSTLNRGLDCDVIVAEVRATSHKPDEIYGIIERLSPGTRKIELFGRPHNVQPNWITLGNQVEGTRIVDPELLASFKKRYPDGNCMMPPLK